MKIFLHAILVGAFLMATTWWANRTLGPADSADGGDAELLIGAANVLFLCVGMATVMILINDQLARALAVAGAVALVRFRVKLAGKFQGIALFYGVLTGMACGVGRQELAWAAALTFAILIAAVLKLALPPAEKQAEK